MVNISKYALDKNPRGKYIEIDEIEDYILKNKPDMVINERSNGVEHHEKIERLCRRENITTICLLDLQGGYANRFKEMPDYIIVPSAN